MDMILFCLTIGGLTLLAVALAVYVMEKISEAWD